MTDAITHGGTDFANLWRYGGCPARRGAAASNVPNAQLSVWERSGTVHQVDTDAGEAMPGFTFRYRLSGHRATVKSLTVKNAATLIRGDVVSDEAGQVGLGATGDTAFVGVVQETLDGNASTTSIRVIVDADAVYAVDDGHERLKGDTLDLGGVSGAQGVGASVSTDFVVDVDSAAHDETLVRCNGASHRDPAADAEPETPLVGGELNAAIARAVVRYHATHFDRGPTKAHAFYHDNIVVVVLEDVLTRSERSVAAAGGTDAVLGFKRAGQDFVRPYLRSAIERLTGIKVRAFISTNHVDPDLAAELFILDRPIPGQHQQPGSAAVGPLGAAAGDPLASGGGPDQPRSVSAAPRRRSDA